MKTSEIQGEEKTLVLWRLYQICQ